MFSGQLRNHNVIEYVLFLWHTEDLLRSLELNPERVESELIQSQPVGQEDLDRLREWYGNLLKEMKRDGLEKKGHLEETEEILNELFFLHNGLIDALKDKEYQELFTATEPYLKELQVKSKSMSINAVEIILTGLYGASVLRAKGEEISNETKEAIESFTKLLNHLGRRYKEYKSGQMN
jgi:hypothetical protein